MAKVMFDTATIMALISYIPSDGGPSVALIKSVMQEIAPKKPEVVICFELAFDATAGGDKEVAQMAGMSGCCIATLSGWPTRIFVIKNVPEEFVGRDIYLDRINGIEYDDAKKILELVEAKLAEAKK